MTGNLILATAVLAACGHAIAQEVFVPVEGMVFQGPLGPTEAESLAARRFIREVRRFTGQDMPMVWGETVRDRPVLRTGPAAALGEALDPGWRQRLDACDPHVLNQSYVIEAGADARSIIAAGLGEGRTPRTALGLAYALGELLRRLDVRDGRWGFVLPAEPVVASPKTPNRTLYLMNSVQWSSPGLSLPYDDFEALESYVDAVIDARFSRVSLWQWYMIYLYPGSFEDRRAENERIHRGMRHLFEYARRRGLEVYHMLTPMHANPDLLPDDPKYTATGYYGRTSVCWSQPEARELARNMARQEMEYYGPVDGYIVWFYDPGGCFCPDCRKNQGANLFEQLMLVVELAKSISPDAQFEACLWPTWCFDEPLWGINFPREDVKAFVREFLDRALDRFGPRNLTIMDSCDTSFTNYEYVIYDGTVKPEEFKRNGFMHRVLGTPGEASYPFSPFMFRYLSKVMGEARDRGLEECLFSAIYVGSTFPSLYAFADTLWHADASASETILRYASTAAKGAARDRFAELLTALEDLNDARTYADKDAALKRGEKAWAALEADPLFFGGRDWLRGYLGAQRSYLEMARAKDEESFQREFQRFRDTVGTIPLYAGFMRDTLTRELCAKYHVAGYWRAPVGDTSTVGLPDAAPAAQWIGAPGEAK